VIAADQPYTFLYVPKTTTLLDRKLVRLPADQAGGPRYLPIVPDRAGGLKYHFTEWIKTPRPVTPELSAR
jgi:hypothetical protein